MSRMGSAAATKLGERDFPCHKLLILASEIINPATGSALQPYKIFRILGLRHLRVGYYLFLSLLASRI